MHRALELRGEISKVATIRGAARFRGNTVYTHGSIIYRSQNFHIKIFHVEIVLLVSHCIHPYST